MSDNSKIEWTDATWNPVTGCSVVSPGCTNCYAMGLAGTRLRNHPSRAGLTIATKAGPVWNGQVRLNEDWLTQPLKWRRPRMIFVCAHGDLFHEAVPNEWIDRVFAVMALSPQHTYQLLTKRADRMRAYCTDAGVTHRVAQAMDKILVDRDDDGYEKWAPVPDFPKYEVSTRGRVRRDDIVLKQQINPEYGRPSVTLWRDAIPTTVFVHILVLRAWRGPMPDGCETRHRNGERTDNRLINLEWASGSINQQDKVRHGSNGGPAKLTREQAAEIRSAVAAGETQQSIADRYGVSRSLVSLVKDRKVWPDAIDWPLRNVWKGVSAEDQTRADARVPDLLATPAAVRFVSAEPLLGPIDFTQWMKGLAHGDSKERRGNRVPACAGGGADDRPGGADMASFGATSGSLDGENQSDSLRGTAASGTRHGEISDRQSDDRRQTDDGLRAQAGLAPFQRADPERVDRQSQGWPEKGQSPVESRIGDAFRTDDPCDQGLGLSTGAQLSWVIVGGESGPSARPMHPAWARAIRDQCAAAGVAFFFKQMTKKGPIPDDLLVREFPHAR